MHRRKIRYAAPGGPDPPPTPDPSAPPGGERVLSVSDLTRGIRRLLESAFTRVAVRGEVTGLSRPASGHLYFNLREASRSGEAQVAVVLFRDDALRLRFRLSDGLRVVARGRVAVYEPRGCYQLQASTVEPDGPGEIALAFERLKARLAAEGLFARERKRPLPFLPRRIGVVTSLGAAALQDVLRSISRRHPGAWVRVVPARVQGEGSAEEVARAVELLGRPESGVEVVIIARGGGSPEDLWTFNEERVVRAVAACPVPTVSAVGHEVDFTLCDFAADARAQTPTHAGELVVPEVGKLRALLDERSSRLGEALRRRIIGARERLDRLSLSRALRDPAEQVRLRARRLDELARALQNTLYTKTSRWQDMTRVFSDKLEALSPLKVLSRGYSVVFDSLGKVVRKASDLRRGDVIRLLLHEGEASATVEGATVDGGTAKKVKNGNGE